MNIQEILSLLACPACHGDLSLHGEPTQADGLICQNCRLLFPIRDDIPIMLLSEALPLDGDQKKPANS
ncbi:MAG: Trm112 family protein [Desulfovibrionaceae bacterium]|nr:Trm112 family protein [Desulfovibrionaceae bacterium]